MPVDIHLKDTLENLDIEYGGDNMYKILGPTMLSWTATDSSRMYMFTSHLKQTLAILDPEVPRIATGFENSIGKYNNAFLKLDGQWEVKQIIPKFTQRDDYGKSQIVTIILYNKRTDTYEMIEKPIAESLTEKFGFMYDTTFIDNLQEGMKITDPIVYKSTAYDNHMNYRYGKNARVFYSTSTDTIEDAIVVRRGWANGVKSVEVDTIQVPVNNNDVLLNLYGNDKEYKAFPDIGEMVHDSLICATRQINKTHLLYDFQKAAMRELTDTDTDYYTSKNSIVYDINVYYNGDDEFPNNLFNAQLRRYYLDGCRYADEVLKACNMIKESGSNYTDNVSYYRHKYIHYNDSRYKWKNKDRAFGHVVVEFKVKSIVSLELGAKLSGRFGNKGVISHIMEEDENNIRDMVVDSLDDGSMTEEEKILLKSQVSIVDDERMPYYYRDGEKIYADVMCNSSGAIRRLNPVQLCEVETNFIAEQVQQLIKKTKSMEKKEKMIFTLLKILAPEEHDFYRNLLDGYSTQKMINGVTVNFNAPESKAAFIKSVEEDGFFIVRPPHKPLLYNDVIALYEAFPEVKPVDIYVDIFGTKSRKTMRKGVIGYQYMIVLKQNSNKNFSARSTFRVNRSNLPAKDIAKKTNRSSYARTPVRLSEIYNLLASISSEDLAEFNVFFRSSAIGRKSLDRIISADGNPLKIKKLKVQDNFTNTNADILAAKLKTLGLRIYFSTLPEGRVQVWDDNVMTALHFGKYTIYDYPRYRKMYQDLFSAFDREKRSFIMVESYKGQKDDICWDRVFENEEFKKLYSERMTPDLLDSLKNCTKGHNDSIEQMIARSGKRVSATYKADGSAPKKRGRKSKKEKEELERLLREQEAALQNESDDASEDDDSIDEASDETDTEIEEIDEE